jgi:hypothetical protein
VIVALDGLITIRAITPLAVTWSEALPVAPPELPSTVCDPASEAVQEAATQEPSGAIVNVVLEVTSPSGLSYRSRPCAVYAWKPPAATLAEVGDSARWSSAPAVTLRAAVLVWLLLIPVTVCEPTVVAVQTLPAHEPSGLIENLVLEVTSPIGLPEESKLCAVYDWVLPAAIVALEGLITMWLLVPASTWSVAVPVFVDFVAVTVCVPALEAVQAAPVQEPSGLIVKVVVAVTSPIELS